MPPISYYLIPHEIDEGEAGSGASPLLARLVQTLLQEQTLALGSAKALVDSSGDAQALSAVYAQRLLSDPSIQLAQSMMDCLHHICQTTLHACQHQLWTLAHVLDESHDDSALEHFCSHIHQLRLVYCMGSQASHPLLLKVQATIPALARLSSQIDNEALAQQIAIANLSQSAVLPRLMQLEHITQLNAQVNHMLTAAQDVINMLTDWQDRLQVLISQSPQDMPPHFYKNQVDTALTYWHHLQNTLTSLLTHFESPL